MNPGDLIATRYRLDAPIAAGGMGDVWRAHDVVLNRPVALKMLRSGVREDPTFGDRFRVEARALAAIDHPGVVSVYDYDEIDSTDPCGHGAYLVMAYVDGEPLTSWLGAPLDPGLTMDFVAQIARALAAVHAAGIIHRDVKPDNLLISSDHQVVLVDFGIVSSSFATDLTGAGQVLGTARYMAPEQATRRQLSPATDIYALGAVAYQCLAGRPPFDGESPISIAMSHLRDDPPPLPDTLPASVRGVVMTALAKDPADRFASASEMAVAAEAAQANTVAAAMGSGTADTATTVAIDPMPLRSPVVAAAASATVYMPPVHRRRGLVGGLIGAAALIIAGIFTAIALSGGAGGDPSQSHQSTNHHPSSSPKQHPVGPSRNGGTSPASTPSPSASAGTKSPGTRTTRPTTGTPKTSAPTTDNPSTSAPSNSTSTNAPTPPPTTSPPASVGSSGPGDSPGGAGAGGGTGVGGGAGAGGGAGNTPGSGGSSSADTGGDSGSGEATGGGSASSPAGDGGPTASPSGGG